MVNVRMSTIMLQRRFLVSMHANMLHERYILYYKYVFSYAVLYFLHWCIVLLSAHTFLFALRSM